MKAKIAPALGMTTVDWKKKKEDEFEALIDNFATFIRVHIHKFNLPKFGLDPEDIAQEIKIKIWAILKSEKEIRNYPSYIKKIVHSSVIDVLRKRKRDEGIYSQAKHNRISETAKDYIADIQMEERYKEIIAAAVNSLIESRRRAVKLYLLGMTIEEMASFYGWSQHKTRNLLYRGLADLKKMLKKKEVNYENK
jgi:RNA polymerase sigma factor (sigma-70 family)